MTIARRYLAGGRGHRMVPFTVAIADDLPSVQMDNLSPTTPTVEVVNEVCNRPLVFPNSRQQSGT